MKSRFKLSEEVDKICQQSLKDNADYLFEAVQAYCPVDTGNMLEHLEKDMTHIKRGKVVIGFRKDESMMAHDRRQTYAEIVQKGSKPHKIKAKNAPNLAIPIETFKEPVRKTERVKNGKFITKEVNHPGTKPNDFMQKAIDETLRAKV
ncbi:HK97 gp10 family phage protein [Faecalibaculum rodentium]|uniref:HK97 gp10 family phage protein n=1 Tax=Faecalibaculum rodentium TaxID=1702221 RepID=UPI00272CB7CE|nr:HK97 gp10 family phage protein [Faecalibaculum rodentium]